jgi:hypothetical protein
MLRYSKPSLHLFRNNNICLISAAGSHAKFKQSAWTETANSTNNEQQQPQQEQQQQQQQTTNSSYSNFGGGGCGSGGCGGCGGGGQKQQNSSSNGGNKVYDEHAKYLIFRNAVANMSRGMLYFVFVSEFMWPSVLLK